MVVMVELVLAAVLMVGVLVVMKFVFSLISSANAIYLISAM